MDAVTSWGFGVAWEGFAKIVIGHQLGIFALLYVYINVNTGWKKWEGKVKCKCKVIH